MSSGTKFAWCCKLIYCFDANVPCELMRGGMDVGRAQGGYEQVHFATCYRLGKGACQYFLLLFCTVIRFSPHLS